MKRYSGPTYNPLEEGEAPYYWIVTAVAGDPEEGGVVISTELITKKYERVEESVSRLLGMKVADGRAVFVTVQAVQVTQDSVFVA